MDLSGFVNREADISEAGRVAKQVTGVISVHNNLIVKGAVASATAAERRAEQGLPTVLGITQKPAYLQKRSL